MIPQSKSSINIALCFVALFMTAVANAQLSSIPHRHRRNKFDHDKQEGFRRKQRQQRQQHQQYKNKIGRKLDGDFSTSLQESVIDTAVPSSSKASKANSVKMMSIPLQQAEFEFIDMAVPSSSKASKASSMRMMSIPLQERNFDMSTPLRESDFDLSMPTQTKRKKLERTIAMESNNNESKILFASFLVGISSLVVGAMALFVKARKLHTSQLEESSHRISLSDLTLGSDFNPMVRVTYSFDDDINECRDGDQPRKEKHEEDEALNSVPVAEWSPPGEDAVNQVWEKALAKHGKQESFCDQFEKYYDKLYQIKGNSSNGEKKHEMPSPR